MTAGGDDRLADVEGRRHATGLDGDVYAFPTGEFHHTTTRVLAATVDRTRGAELLRGLEAVVVDVDHHDLSRRVEARREQGSEPDGARADDGDRVAGLHLPVQDAA